MRPLLWIGLAALVLTAGTAAVSAGPRLRITKAKWNSGDRELKVEGKNAGRRAKVSVWDAKSGDLLGTTRAKKSGEWKILIRRLRTSPASVKVTSGKRNAVRTVDGASSNESDDDDESDDNDDDESGSGSGGGSTLQSLAVSGPSSVKEVGTATYAATVTYTDSTTKTVTSTATWTVSPSGPTIAKGVLSTSDVTGNQVVTLSASFTESGSTVSGTTNVTILDSSAGTLTGSHKSRFTKYEGTKTCLTCHKDEAKDLHASVHFQWTGDSSSVVGSDLSDQGKLGGINDFCIYPDINWIGQLTNKSGDKVDGGCAKCHVGLGPKPTAIATDAALEDIDCLICHSDSYERKVDLVDGKFRFVPDAARMKVSVLQAAVDIGKPSSDACLGCHAYSGGGDNFKRGDIEAAHASASKSFDVHMAPKSSGGAGLTCSSCHPTADHRTAGRGVDLRPIDSSKAVRCTNCHSSSPHGEKKIDKHTAKLDCTVCHIPTFAKSAATDMERDWSKAGELNTAKGLYEPHMVQKKNVVPVYRFWNGDSIFYEFGEEAVAQKNGRILMAGPDGDVADSDAKLFAFKHHLGNQPIDPVTDQLLPLKIGIFFTSGNLAKAVAEGVKAVGWTDNDYEFAKTERYLGIFHEVVPSEGALDCDDCHGGTRIDFDTLGYGRNASYKGKPLCASCHEDESGEWKSSELFEKVHEKHVKDKKYDCSVCHSFTRR